MVIFTILLFVCKTDFKYSFRVLMISENDNISDNLLVTKIRHNYQYAFKSLYNRYSKKIYFFSIFT